MLPSHASQLWFPARITRQSWFSLAMKSHEVPHDSTSASMCQVAVGIQGN